MILQAQINMVLCILFVFFFVFCFGASWSLSFLKEEFHHISKMQSIYHLKKRVAAGFMFNYLLTPPLPCSPVQHLHGFASGCE